MADLGFPLGSANSPGGAPIYDFAKFSQKLHEIERIWTPGEVARPKFYYVDPPLTLNLNLIRNGKRNLARGYIFRIVRYSVHRRHEGSVWGEECLQWDLHFWGLPSGASLPEAGCNILLGFFLVLHKITQFHDFFSTGNSCLILQISQSTVNPVHWSKVVPQVARHITVTKLQV